MLQVDSKMREGCSLLQSHGLWWAEAVIIKLWPRELRGPDQTVISLLAGKPTENSQHEVFARDLHHRELHRYARYYWQPWPKSCSLPVVVHFENSHSVNSSSPVLRA